MISSRGQGALEYLLLLGGVLAIAAVVITVVFGVGGSGNDIVNTRGEEVLNSLEGGLGTAAGICGDDNIDPGEICDGTDLDLQTCLTIPGGFTGGTLDCLGDCSDYDTSACTSPVIPPTLSNGTIDAIPAEEPGQANLAFDTGSATISVDTDLAATCQYNIIGGLDYGHINMSDFETTGGLTTHTDSVFLSALNNGDTGRIYIRCINDATLDPNMLDYEIRYSVAEDLNFYTGWDGAGFSLFEDDISARYWNGTALPTEPPPDYGEAFVGSTTAAGVLSRTFFGRIKLDGIPQNSHIDSAWIYLNPRGDWSNNLNTKIQLLNANDAPTNDWVSNGFNDTDYPLADDLMAIDMTGLEVPWVIDTQWIDNEQIQSPLVTSLVQARVDDPLYNDGDYFGFRIEEDPVLVNSGRNFNTCDNGHSPPGIIPPELRVIFNKPA